VERREFWAVQVLVAAISVGHLWLEAAPALDEHIGLYLVPTLLYLIPVVYAAVNFGLAGSLPTAVWSAVLVLPNLLMLHDGAELVGEVIQIGWVLFAAVLVGMRVDLERAARIDAVEREDARRGSERRYRAIFDDAIEAIVLLGESGRIQAANAAAAALLGRSVPELVGGEIPGTLGRQVREAIGDMDPRQEGVRRLVHLEDRPAWVEVIATPLSASEDVSGTQVLIRDVTVSQERERGLEAIARLTLVAREEEQRRIAHELHDGPVQSLVQLWRALDALIPQVGEAQADALTDARGLVQSVADQLRRSSRDLRPSVLDDLGIAAALRSETQALAGRSGIVARLTVTGRERRLPPELELALLRVAQEALRNAERHSGAATVAVRLAFRAADLRLTITDDGRGLDRVPTASELLSGGHLGIVGMRERARLAGASLSLGTSASGGLAVKVHAPIVDGAMGPPMEDDRDAGLSG
jgi:two-component system, NarL family, sensor histidine kinase UhpB